MQRYGNLSGHSGVVAYELGEGSITIKFAGDGSPCYLYNADRPGPEAVEEMQRLARAGKGLATYISRHVGDKYAERR
ncbi:hypothetical protein [Pseudomonas sp. RIT-PI-S]|uniref:hypothetical protein n=1 Tax=Pseudomonas sp. RIT-PI-S TaxID=3035295 RepID=UPI0021DACAA0|nr:hypothetical protein [Pseudomonas sp. RIT-PI-S]